MKITGTVRYESLEGGFWGIEADDKTRYLPIDELPDSVRTNGCRVEADLEPAHALSFAMWGKTVRVRSIRPLG